ncbi:MAG TPA: hypothetical protein VMQ61_12395 [Thermoanaerobaculia bacterium]|nr:hypothetical protein [Thermoanaerobaculia bacterium]
MFIGHYGVALVGKRASPKLPLGLLFLAVQLLDILFAVFVLCGIEGLRIVHGFTPYNPYDLYRMPYTHSLVGALFWSALIGWIWWMAAGRVPAGERRAAALVLGGAVFSHFVLDVPMHTPDMPLWPGAGAPKIGLGLWNHRDAAVLAELAVLVVGGWIYLRASRPKSRFARVGTIAFAISLVAMTVATPFQPDPKSPAAFAVTALAAYVGLAVVAALIDRGREISGERAQ